MIQLGIAIGVLVLALASSFAYIKRLISKKAKIEKELQILQTGVKDGLKAKTRINKRNADNTNTVRERLRKDSRK